MIQNARILIVDDDPAILQGIAQELRAEGYETITAVDGREGFEKFTIQKPDLVLTDVAMPVVDGFGLITALRKSAATPIIVLSVRGGESDRIRALDLGADDFVSKPFSVRELLARVRAQLRRSGLATVPQLQFPELLIDFERRRVVQGDREIHLTPTEFALLSLLTMNAGKAVMTDQIIARVWKNAPATSPDTVRVHVASLRKKIEPDPSNPRYIITEPWIGYRFIAEPIDR